MSTNLLDKYYADTEKFYLSLNKKRAEAILEECKELGIYHLYDKDNPLNNLILNYMSLKQRNKEAVIDEILHRYDINYNSSIQSAISYLLNDSPYTLLWPGIISKDRCDSKYILKSKCGVISVYKASDFFKHTKVDYIFDKKLSGECFDRTFDFIKECRDYNAILSFEYNLLGGGHFHAYLEKDDITLDIAGNALYKSREDKDKVLKGEVLAKLTYEEVLDEFAKILQEITDLESDDDKLQVLALYYGKKKDIK